MPAPRRTVVPASRWRRGLVATERIGRWLKSWEDRARRLREGEEPPDKPPRRRG
jgi:hypothetical protein